ncbi:glycoside hydrolase family 32 protein [uncultured Lactobacillus sp.]|uniref:glycoside hydrolase family 32 protein n=1 Tax=uncultured Lactobacillus sp. TaxID=153152 RepID=UPI002609ACAE|nr:glycoside hydrolase family 32 protein [uncultured Lactobacillus sp.]
MKANESLYKKIRNLDQDILRPEFHFTAPYGWLNDPNGLVYYQNYYQLFYQYNPYGTSWNKMYWGHARSKDLLNWQDMPIAMQPDHDYDKSGVFSGSAIKKGDRLYVIYTGHVEEKGHVVETQCIAYTDNGVDFTKYKNNPVMTARDIPYNVDESNFRDPKVFEHNGKYYCVVAVAIDGKGTIVLFESSDLLNWKFKTVLLKDDPALGVMTECPDLIAFKDNDYLIFSSILGKGKNSIVYSAQGKLDWKEFQFNVEKIHRLDSGDDFYAPQSLIKNGEHILIPWLRSVDHVNYLDRTGHAWNGIMGIPRKLLDNDGYLHQVPIGKIDEINTPIDQSIENGSYKLNFCFPKDKKLVLHGINGNISIEKSDEDYLINIDGPVFEKKVNWNSKVSCLIFVIDNSTLELFSKHDSLSIVTFISEIYRLTWEEK